MGKPEVVLGEEARSDKSPQDSIESAPVTSGRLSQFIGALWPVGEQIREHKYGHHMNGLRNVSHRYHLEQLAAGLSLCRRLLLCFLVALTIVLLKRKSFARGEITTGSLAPLLDKGLHFYESLESAGPFSELSLALIGTPTGQYRLLGIAGKHSGLCLPTRCYTVPNLSQRREDPLRSITLLR